MKLERRPLAQKLVVYSLGAGAASLASHAKADIIYSGPVEFSGDQIHFDLENTIGPSNTSMPGDDFVLQSKITTKGGNTTYKAKVYNDSGSNATTPSVAFTLGVHDYALRLSAGDTIGGQTFASGDVYMNDNGGPGSQWHSGDRGFLGLRLTINANSYYGWADVSLNNVTESAPGEFTLHSYAFDNVPDEPIVAGIPEPTTLALLVSGAAGVAALKRRKK